MEKVHPFMLICNTRTETPQYMEYFSLEFNNQTSKLLFTILHIWFIHRGFHRNNLETRKMLIWEHLWDRMRDILIASGGDSDTYERKLVDMQSRTFGLCLSFDEAFDFYNENGDPKMIKKIISRAFYNSENDGYGSENVDRLTFYSIMMESFMTQLPKRELKYGLFQWLVS
ncbi:conserved hypothetical protein [Theileria orientalis strain Shintoku]|uniref:Ubiquinol-cytochrome c chaperone domain-containing protein n=1 Tax=Theileria orientalis strain Shintoku TaxID=869250 RepID=J4C917_THEOR|nr:conserved hypothetical protein [Theileria orientalis strain Shintoku]BAM41758.1 conserved hypothetical protein [Theileria orientalis strain Shintoku]|eukprot:XP_009692059.1 conserved hypothetical protein [Theileria orientalis strain Shintoku]